jgi:hypothetical protein
MLRINSGLVLGLWAATIVAAFAVGRTTTPTEAAGAPADLGAAVRSALAEAGSLERLGRTANLMQHLDAETLPGVVAVYDRMLSVLDECEIRPFVEAWTRFDPTGALDHTLAWQFRTKQKFGVDAAIRGWALRDPFEAQLVSEQIAQDHPTLREGSFQNLVIGWVQSEQKGLDSYVAGLSPMSRDEATGIVVGGLMRKGGPEPTLRWVDAMLAEEEHDWNFKKSVFRRGARAAARWYPEQAAKWVVEHEGENYAERGVQFVAEQWAERDGASAMQWVREQPAVESRDEAARSAFNRWSNVDRKGAEKWLRSETLTPFHDPAIDAFARQIDKQRPREAVGWCERIEDLDRQYGCLRATAVEWYRRDAVAAEKWLQTSPLTEEDRRAARTPKRKKQRARGAEGKRPTGRAGPAEGPR